LSEPAGGYRHAVGAQPFGSCKVESQVRRGDLYEQYVVSLESSVRLSMKSVSPQLAPLRERLAALVEPFSVGLLSVLDHGVGSPNGDLLVVTEPTGATLREGLDSGGPLAPAQALPYLRDMARALAVLEARGLPMPTVSPEAVCLRQDGVRLDDYFLPLLFEGRRLPPNFFLARYSAPELEETGPSSRTTLFSLGMVFYEMLTGRHAFEGAVYQVIAAIHTVDADLSNVPDHARPLLSRLLARNPEERFGSLAELAGAFGGDSVVIEPSEWAAPGVEAPGEATPAAAKKKGPRLEPLGQNEFGCPEFRRSQDGAVMVLVPGGSLTMGCAGGGDAEKPTVGLQLEPFLIDKFPVTWEMFVAMHAGHDRSCEFCGERNRILPSRFMPSPLKARDRQDWSDIEVRYAALNDAVSAAGGEKVPASYLTWRDMRRYAEMVGAELPCEAEWEYADRAGTQTLYPWGDTMDPAGAWFEGNSGGVPHPVGQKRPNAWGLHDMNGNVLEMCRDRFVKGMYEMIAGGAATAEELLEGVSRPAPACSARGGAFTSTESGVTASFRVGAAPEKRSEVRGFRCAIRRKNAPDWARQVFEAGG
jgi:formylglycine-generating enzyme required for sulfatase activity